LRNEANLWRKWLIWLGGWRFGGRGGLEVQEGVEGAEEHAIGGIDATLNTGKGIEDGVESVAEGGIVLDGGVDRVGLREVFVDAFDLVVPNLGFDAAEAALNPFGGD